MPRLILHEEGRLKLDDPISKYLPAFDKPKVMRGGTAKAPVLVAAKTPITVKHLLTHTSGYIYGFGKDPIDTIYNDAKMLQSPSTEVFLERASKMPLVQQPGQSFRYGISTDLLGAVVEKVSGQTLDAFIASRITGPLGMKETSFTVPAEKRGRVAKVYTTGKQGQLTEAKALVPGGVPYPDEQGRLFPSGGGGMFSTIGDYARFGQMLLNGGALDGVRILGRKTVELMETNHLSGLTRETVDSNDYEGFGLGGSVRVSLARGARLGSVGQFGWSGAATTDFKIDPQEQLMTLVFTQHFPFNQHDLFWNALTLTYAALVDDGEVRRARDSGTTASGDSRRNQVRHPAARHLWPPTREIGRPVPLGEHPVDGRVNRPGFVDGAETVFEQHRRGCNRADRVGDVPPRDVRRRPVHRLEHPGPVPDARRRQQPDGSGDHGRFVREDVAEEVFRQDHVEA